MTRQIWLLIAALIISLSAGRTDAAINFSHIFKDVRGDYGSRTTYQLKKALLRDLKRDGDLSGREFFVLGIVCQLDDVPNSIILSMTRAAKCGSEVADFFNRAGLRGVAEGFYKASTHEDDSALALQQVALAGAFWGSTEQDIDNLESIQATAYSRFVAERSETEVGVVLDEAKSLAQSLISQGVYSRASFDMSMFTESPFEAAPDNFFYSASRDAPFGLRFGMSPGDVGLEKVETSAYKGARRSGGNSLFECDQNIYGLGLGAIYWSGLSDSETNNLRKILRGWLEAIGADARDGLARDIRAHFFDGLDKSELQNRFLVNSYLHINADLLETTEIAYFKTENGLRLCTLFHNSKLVRVVANLSAAREIIEPLISRVSGDYMGSEHVAFKYTPKFLIESTTHKWRGHPEGVWTRINYNERGSSGSADLSRLSPADIYPTAAERAATATYTYAPLMRQMVNDYEEAVIRYRNDLETRREERKKGLLDDFN